MDHTSGKDHLIGPGRNREVNARRLFIPDFEGRWKKTVEADRAIQLKLRGEGNFKKHNKERGAQGLLGPPILDRRNHLAIDDPNGQDRKEESDGEPDPIEQPARSHDVTPDRTTQRIRRRPKQRRRGGEEDEDEDKEDIQLDDKEGDIQVDGKEKDVQIDDNDEDPMDIDQQPLRGSKKRNRGAGSGMGAQLAQDVTRSTTTRARANMGSGRRSQRRAVKLRSPADDPTEIADDTEGSRPAGLLTGAQQHLTAVGSTRPGSVQSSAKLPRAADATSDSGLRTTGEIVRFPDLGQTPPEITQPPSQPAADAPSGHANDAQDRYLELIADNPQSTSTAAGSQLASAAIGNNQPQQPPQIIH
ncbi:unnamed protein product [Zymoseptoria tritici ST99CH_1E4]|uniref:Uncharacterized protein n=1 Tax=Zymoseptoria tritici ST99CH_1E4 TaxID=1276532 RepID=A0A2H1HBX5_ZYMTR|nr:unnamed protein product [Zymoseptoria tritici ST99CH_1E4]